MSLAHVVPGRYTAQIKDWGVSEIDRPESPVHGQLEVWIAFDFKDQAGGLQSVTWKSLLEKKEGGRSEYAFKALETCGLTDGDMIRFMEDASALDMATPVDITIEDNPSADGMKTYKNVKWINKVGGGQRNKPEGDAKMSIQQKLARAGMGKMPTKKAAPKNYAPGADGKSVSTPQNESPGFDDSDVIPF